MSFLCDTLPTSCNALTVWHVARRLTKSDFNSILGGRIRSCMDAAEAATMSGDAPGSQDKWWTSVSMPTPWMVPPVIRGVVSRTLEKRSCCELEVDACVEHVLNRSEVGTFSNRGHKLLLLLLLPGTSMKTLVLTEGTMGCTNSKQR